jgi:hypothetical protein
MSETRTPLPHPLCAHLASKKLHMISDDREICLEDLQTAGYETYWCQHTMTDTGPDGGWVMFERCSPARSCFEALERSTSCAYRARESTA